MRYKNAHEWMICGRWIHFMYAMMHKYECHIKTDKIYLTGANKVSLFLLYALKNLLKKLNSIKIDSFCFYSQKLFVIRMERNCNFKNLAVSGIPRFDNDFEIR